MSPNLEARLSLTMLGMSTLVIIMSFAYVKKLNEESKRIKHKQEAYNSYVLEKPKFSHEEAKDWQSDSTISMEKRNVYKYWQSK